LVFNSLNEIPFIKRLLNEKRILILGFYLNNIFFYKKDFNLDNLNLKKSLIILFKRKAIALKSIIKLILLFKNLIKKTIYPLKNGNN